MKKWVVANWKMQGTRENLLKLARETLEQSHSMPPKTEIILCPSFPFLGEIASLIKEPPLAASFKLGAQDCSAETEGAFTGEVSASMLKDFSCSHVIIGHSERRLRHQETPSLIRLKIMQALKSGLMPILCVGEGEEHRACGKALETVITQVEASLESIQEIVLLAYEPLWAIGTGKTPSQEEITEMHSALKKRWPNLPLLYGGSVSAQNVSLIYSCKNVDGILVGGSSLKASEFLEIIKQS